jgi:hypothetical protein
VAEFLTSRWLGPSGMPNRIDDMQLMRFAHYPKITWRAVPGPRRRVNRCGLCGWRSPPLFDVPDVVWQRYIPAEQLAHVVCIGCWNWLVEVIDGGACQAQHGGPLPLWSTAWRVRHGIPLDAPCPVLV